MSNLADAIEKAKNNEYDEDEFDEEEEIDDDTNLVDDVHSFIKEALSVNDDKIDKWICVLMLIEAILKGEGITYSKDPTTALSEDTGRVFVSTNDPNVTISFPIISEDYQKSALNYMIKTEFKDITFHLNSKRCWTSKGTFSSTAMKGNYEMKNDFVIFKNLY